MTIITEHVLYKAPVLMNSEKLHESKTLEVAVKTLANRKLNAETLNQKWNEVARPHVYTKAGCRGLSFLEGLVKTLLFSIQKFFGWTSTESALEMIGRKGHNYQFGEVIEKIRALQAQGKKICLLIGRTPLESLPAPKENEVWISLDISLFPQTKAPQCNYDDDRLHLWLDLNQPQSLELIQGLFDEVIIDFSTTKAFSGDYAKLFSTLLQDPATSTLSFEYEMKRSMRNQGTDQELQEEYLNTDGYHYRVGIDLVITKESQYHEKNPSSTPEQTTEAVDKQLDDRATEAILRHFQQLYQNVKLCNCHMSPSNHCSGSVIDATHFTMSGKIQQEENSKDELLL